MHKQSAPFYMWRVFVPMKIVAIKTFIIISTHTFDYLLLKTFLNLYLLQNLLNINYLTKFTENIYKLFQFKKKLSDIVNLNLQ